MQQRMNADNLHVAFSSADLFKKECCRAVQLLEPIRIDQNGVTDSVTTLT
jgi:hypothetical protein